MHKDREYQETANLWHKALKDQRLEYPDEYIVRFLTHAVQQRSVQSGDMALDVGFGSGRHLRLLAEFGFVVNGLEIIDRPVDELVESLHELPVGQLLIQPLSSRPFDDESMEVIILWGVIFLRATAAMRSDLTAARQMLARGGRAVVNFRSKDNWFRPFGSETEEGTTVLNDRAGPYSGMTYTFVDHNEAVGLCESAGFEVERIQRVDWWQDFPDRQHSWWHLWLVKR